MVTRISSISVAVLAITTGLMAAPPKTAAPKPPTPPRTPAILPLPVVQKVTHRITGLFSKDREADLREALEALPEIELVSVDFDHAEGVFSYDPTKAFAGTKVDKIVDRFDQLLRQASNQTMGIKERCTTPMEKLERIEIPVGGLDCRACCLAAYEMIAKLDGVEQATASFKEGKMTALINPAKIDRGKLEAVLKEKGVTLVGKP